MLNNEICCDGEECHDHECDGESCGDPGMQHMLPKTARVALHARPVPTRANAAHSSRNRAH